MKLEERALVGLPIETEYGNFKPLTVYDYMDCAVYLSAISFDKKRVLHEIRLGQPEDKRNSEEITQLLKELNEKLSLKEIILTYIQVYFNPYVEVLSRCLFYDIEDDEKRVETAFNYLLEVDNDQFDEIRKILLLINNQSEQTAFLNPILQREKERTLRFKSQENESSSPDISTIVTSIVIYSGITYEEILKWNVAQLLQAFQRIQMFQNYATSTLFATVAGDKVEIHEWSKNIEIHNDSNTDSSFATKFDSIKQQIGKQLN